MTLLSVRHALILAAALLAAACIDERCDPGQEFAGGICADVVIVVDARVVDAGDGDGASVPFNAVCGDDTQCGGVTNYCAVQPGQAVGFCTHTGCIEDPTVCPSGASCIDLTPYGAPGLSLCYGGGS